MRQYEENNGGEYLYFYTGGSKGGNQEIKLLLNDMESSKIENVKNTVTRKIHGYVTRIKSLPEVEVSYMKFDELMRYERRDGYLEAKEQLNRLNELLIRDGRIEDLQKSTQDEAYQDMLLVEYGLVNFDEDDE
ncbi:MAG: hypothetical protein IJZ82_12550 [Lachnospiraceae bacterium]|nr:hypothetical protein [Lachnospiraceae bacterium]